ncbi:MAG TPA: hypothetical protein VKA19_06295, partial [Alphaproteobacteria bacterium]|nr:hypothetical protein [Alphaproteobacteria bacterium]
LLRHVVEVLDGLILLEIELGHHRHSLLIRRSGGSPSAFCRYFRRWRGLVTLMDGYRRLTLRRMVAAWDRLSVPAFTP